MIADLLRAPSRTTSRYQAIDLLRGIAAIAVLFWHYQHFYMGPPGGEAQNLANEPFLSTFWILYRYGDRAVQLFWTISGFIFAAVYVGSSVSTHDFVRARFARLYPLHLVTLVTVCILQRVSVLRTGTTQIYGNFDLYHFALNLGFVSAWGFERGYSFNGPIWSVSIEILVYALFWFSRKWLFRLGRVLI